VPIFSNGRVSTSALGYRAPLAAGDAGTAQTIKVMRQLIDQDLANADFVNFAKSLVRNVPSHDEMGEVEAIYDWVHSNIRFVKDPLTKETLYPPSELLKIRQGDCDDSAMLMSALALAVGYPARLVTVAANAQSADEFSHVYAEIEIPPGTNNWVAADAARPNSQFGVHPPMYYRRRAWSLTDDSYQDLHGMTRMRGLGYVRYRTLGQDDGGSGGAFDWTSIITQGLQETPQIMAIAEGQGTRSNLLSTSPYGSFATQYTPGYGLPQAGYPSYGYSQPLPNWVLPAAIIALLAMFAIPPGREH
jgi:hypothetical protein